MTPKTEPKAIPKGLQNDMNIDIDFGHPTTVAHQKVVLVVWVGTPAPGGGAARAARPLPPGTHACAKRTINIKQIAN